MVMLLLHSVGFNEVISQRNCRSIHLNKCYTLFSYIMRPTTPKTPAFSVHMAHAEQSSESQHAFTHDSVAHGIEAHVPPLENDYLAARYGGWCLCVIRTV